jgi:hypothetical protein
MNARFHLVKNLMLHWMEYHNLKKISMNMRRFHGFKLLKNVIDEWRQVTDDKNDERVKLIHVRSGMCDNPSLVRPLLVIKNLTMFRGF